MYALFKHKVYEVQLEASQLVRPLVLLPGVGTELIHPLDCIRLGVLNGGYFNSVLSNKVHSRFSRLDTLASKYFTAAELELLPKYYKCQYDELTYNGCTSRNYFGVAASSCHADWLANGWIQKSAPEGWFECYTQAVVSNNFVSPQGYANNVCTDWLIEQKRLLSFVARHSAQLKAANGDLAKRRKQRQCLLNWASPLAFL